MGRVRLIFINVDYEFDMRRIPFLVLYIGFYIVHMFQNKSDIIFFKLSII